MDKRRDFTIGVAVFFLLLWTLFTHSHPNSWNDASRMATVEALVHQGTWAIDDTVFGERTADRIYLHGHFYSSKPPVLSLLAAALYAVLHNVFQISFDFAGWCDPVVDSFYCFASLRSQSVDWGYYLLTLMLVGFPSALMLALFYKSTALCNISNPMALLATGALGLGTLIFPYSLIFDNHVPAAACLMVSLYALLRSRTGESNSQHFLMLAGFSTALAFTFDLITGPFLIFFMGLAWVRHRRRAWPFLLGGLIPVMLLAVLDWWILGDPLPPHMHPAGYDYAGSLFSASVGGNQSASDVASYAFHMLFGDRGLFTFSLVMLWPVCGLVKVLFQKRHWLWAEAVAVGLASLVVSLYLVLSTDNFGGLAYGTRWFTAIIPVLFFFAVQIHLDRSWPRRLLFIVLGVFSLVFAWQGARAPWAPTLPPAQFFRYIASPIGRYLESLPAGAVSYTTLPQARYLPVYPLHAWHTGLRQFDPSLGVLPAGAPDRVAVYVISPDDQATGELLEAAFPSGQWDLDTEELAVYRVSPGAGRVQPRQTLDAEFAGAIQLLGCDPPPDSLRPGDVVSVRLYWRALVPIRNRYTAFLHLLGPTNPSTGNPLWAQDDHQAGRKTYPTDFWLPGEIILGSFRLVVPKEAPPGEYMLSAGFYDLVTLQRLGRSDATGDTATLFSITVVP